MAIGEHSKKKHGETKISCKRKSTCHSMAIGKKKDGEIENLKRIKLDNNVNVQKQSLEVFFEERCH